MAKAIIAVMGGTGIQGGGVVGDLLAGGRFAVRVLTRNPNSDKAKPSLHRDARSFRGT